MTRTRTILGLTFLFVACWARLVFAFDTSGPTQSGTLRNQQASAAGANAITITAVTNQRIRLYSVSGQCASGAASITIANGATQVWSGTGILTTTFGTVVFGPVPLTGPTGTAMTITASNCFGGGGASTLNVVADQY